MKKIPQFKNKGLSLNKDTIARLNDEQLQHIVGGSTPEEVPLPSCNRRSCSYKCKPDDDDSPTIIIKI